MISKIRNIPFILIALAFSGAAAEPASIAAPPRDRLQVSIRHDCAKVSGFALLKHEVPLPAALVDFGSHQLTAAWGAALPPHRVCMIAAPHPRRLSNKAPPL